MQETTSKNYPSAKFRVVGVDLDGWVENFYWDDNYICKVKFFKGSGCWETQPLHLDESLTLERIKAIQDRATYLSLKPETVDILLLGKLKDNGLNLVAALMSEQFLSRESFKVIINVDGKTISFVDFINKMISWYNDDVNTAARNIVESNLHVRKLRESVDVLEKHLQRKIIDMFPLAEHELED